MNKYPWAGGKQNLEANEIAFFKAIHKFYPFDGLYGGKGPAWHPIWNDSTYRHIIERDFTGKLIDSDFIDHIETISDGREVYHFKGTDFLVGIKNKHGYLDFWKNQG